MLWLQGAVEGSNFWLICIGTVRLSAFAHRSNALRATPSATGPDLPVRSPARRASLSALLTSELSRHWRVLLSALEWSALHFKELLHSALNRGARLLASESVRWRSSSHTVREYLSSASRLLRTCLPAGRLERYPLGPRSSPDSTLVPPIPARPPAGPQTTQ